MFTATSEYGGQLIAPLPSLTEGRHRSQSHGSQFHPLCFIAVKALPTNENTYLLLFLAVAKKKKNPKTKTSEEIVNRPSFPSSLN
jgi:hypothetical protein